MTARETRRYKHRGVTISFGDIMLPLVGIVAIGLLVVAGKLFFVSGVRSERSSVPIQERPMAPSEPLQTEPPVSEQEAIPVSVSEDAEEAASPTRAVSPSAAEGTEGNLPGPRRASIAIDVLAIPYGSAPLDDKAGTQAGASEKKAASPKPEPKRVQVVALPAPKPSASPPPQAPKTRNVPAASPSKNTPAPAKREPQGKVAPKETKTASWQVQVGAFSAKASATEVSRKLSQSGYKVSILSGVRFHRVMVQAGPTRQDAVNVASRLEKEGFVGSFPVPPVSR